MSARDDATARQIKAARPDASTWLAANAGSGKTRVLTDRVARLLLDGVEPQHILCLTYTKAAASEMQNRLFRRLGEWAMRGNADLTDSLEELGVTGAITPDRLRDARRLFARAIETPGGLKIQTIHSFCASLLRRFPLEARVSPQFTEIEDRAADLLRAEIVETMADGADAPLVAGLAEHYTGEDFGKLTRAIVQHRDGFAEPLDWAGVLALFDQPEDLTAARIEASVFLGDEQNIIDKIVPPMLEKGGNDEKAALRLRALSALGFGSLPELESIFLYGKKTKNPFAAKLGALPTKPTQQKLPDVMAALDDFMTRVEQARASRLALLAARKTHALHRFAARFLPIYEMEKLRRGWLDFDDLIDKARALLSDPAVAAWVLFRIDGGIDHVLVDEAQDTSPAQWDVISKLTAEFTSGKGAREDVARTIFVVGDKKQSIYSFQGADPREFDRMQAEFKEKIESAERVFQSETLLYSFRSSHAVLQVVDRAFEDRIDAGFSSEEGHRAFKSALPGRVDLWPVIESQKDEDDRAWYDPLDRRGKTHHTVKLADLIASQIKQMIDNGQTVPEDGETPETPRKRPVRAGDFLILVQRRSELFSEIIRACKKAKLEIAGADRLKVGGELAVRDLGALLSFLAVPEDSLSLASALRSPLFGWSEQDLFALAHRRTQDHLWQALRARADEYPETLAILRDLRANVDFLRPYDLIERILTRHRGRRRLLARLGPEAEDGINALLSQALAYERNAVPSLTGFLVWMETDDLEIKRQIDSASNQIRVMTVHGAKGLEAPIVILPDTGRRDVQIKDDILKMGDTPVWKTLSGDMPTPMDQAIQDMKTAQAHERQRLLYVALTRAEKWLIVAAAGDLPNDGDSWYQTVETALDRAGAIETDFQGLTVKRLSHGDWDDLPDAESEGSAADTVTSDPMFHTPAPPPIEPPRTIAPTDLGGKKALPGETGRSEEEAMAFGTEVHRFLEHYAAAPAEDWPDLTAALLEDADPMMAEAAAEARAVMESDAARALFGPGTLGEVAITAPFGDARLHGVIDRLVFEEGTVLAVDFKTNRTLPATAENCPDGILRQMAAYHIALKQTFPDRTVKLAVFWTRSCEIMHLPHDIVSASLQNTPYLDLLRTAT